MLAVEVPGRQVDDNKLQCLMCETKFSDNDEMETHLCINKMKGRRKGRPRKYVKPTKTWRAKLEKTRIKESQDVAAKKILDSKSSDENTPSPVKRGRGRPRTRHTVLKNETLAIPDPVQVQFTPVQTLPDNSMTEPSPNLSFDMKDVPSENVIDIAVDDEPDDSLEESLDKKDTMFEEKKLVITTEDKPRKKRGPKSTKSPLVCPHCHESFLAEASYYLHVYSHTGIKPFVCEVPGCERGFLSKFKLERHRLIHTSPRHHKCMYCDKSFNRKDHLKNHMITHDPNKKIWKCEICGKEYSYSFSYRTHMAFHAADREETLACGICKKVCESKEQLLFHLKIHTGARAAKNSNEKVHQCFECSKKFFTRKDVKRHMITHTKKKDFLCQFCPQRFGRKDHLTRHLRTTHTGDNANNLPRARRNTGDSSATSSPVKPKRERQTYAQIEPTMVPLQMAIPNMQPEDIQEQLIGQVAVPSQGGSLAGSQATLLHNLQYAVSQIPGHHVTARDIQIPAALYEAAAAASTQQPQEPQQQVQQSDIAAASLNTLQQTTGLPSIHNSLPVQYQIEKGYLLNPPQQEQTVVRPIQVSPNIDYKQITQHLNGNMYITVSNASNLQHQSQTQVQQIQLQQQQPTPQPQQQQQAILTAGKLEPQTIELTRANGLAAVTGLQQPPEYQFAMAHSSLTPTVVSSSDQGQRTPVLMTSSVDNRQNNHPQAYSTILGYMETLRFLDHLPTNNSNTIPLQQLQTLNVDLSQGQQTQLIPAAYNTVSGSNILNINQADLAKGLITIQHPHGTLTSQEIKNVVTLAQTVTPVQHVTYQQQS
ncbi:Zinc finger protein plagl1 [Mactra antiquata]